MSLVLISIDTLRADALGHFGSTAGVTPNFDAHLADSVSFRRAFTAEPQTLSAHASLFTSHHPTSHGVVGRLSGGIALPDSLPTLADSLSAAGYGTAASVSGGFLHPRFDLDRGFETYDYFSDLAPRGHERAPGRTAGETKEAVFEWLDVAQPAESSRREAASRRRHQPASALRRGRASYR